MQHVALRTKRISKLQMQETRLFFAKDKQTGNEVSGTNSA